MWVLQSSPCAKCGFGRYSQASLNPLRLGKERISDRLPPCLLWPASAHGSARCPQRLLAGLYCRQQLCEEGKKKLETKLPWKEQLKKSIPGKATWLLFSFILIYAPGGPSWSLLTALGISFGWRTWGSTCWTAWTGHGFQKMVVSKKQAEMLGNTEGKPERSNKARLRDLENLRGPKDSSETIAPVAHIWASARGKLLRLN